MGILNAMGMLTSASTKQVRKERVSLLPNLNLTCHFLPSVTTAFEVVFLVVKLWIHEATSQIF